MYVPMYESHLTPLAKVFMSISAISDFYRLRGEYQLDMVLSLQKVVVWRSLFKLKSVGIFLIPLVLSEKLYYCIFVLMVI